MRILKHLLTFEDPVDLRSALQQAFVPSDAPSVLSAGPEDLLSTCAAPPCSPRPSPCHAAPVPPFQHAIWTSVGGTLLPASGVDF